MKKFFLVFIALLGFQVTFAQFNFRQHKVVAGDDVYSIAKEYGTTPKAIYNLNPTAEAGIQPDMILVIPNVIQAPEIPVEGIEFKRCKVKKKQTLYSIAKKYKVSIEDIKKYNTFLETDGLKKGDILRIPLPAPKVKKVFRSLNKSSKRKKEKAKKEEQTNVEVVKDSLRTQIYTVKPKETRYGIARKFGITIAELENMNPNLDEDFPIGIEILVPAEVKVETEELTNKFKLYRVPPKQTMYSLSREFKISTDSIIKLNPEIADGLKADMIIQLPNLGIDNEYFNLEKTNLTKNLFNLKPRKIAVMLPFGVTNFSGENPRVYKSSLEKSKVTRVVVDFYSGLALAMDKAADNGISADVIVADTQKSTNVVEELVVKHNLQEVDAVIGPLYDKNVAKLASLLQESKVPVFSPLSKKEIKEYENLYQTLPNAKGLQEKIIKFVKRDTLPKNILIIADKKHQKSKKSLLEAFPDAKVLDPVKDNFIVEKDLLKIIGEEKSKLRNWVFLESSNLLLVSNVASLLNARAKTHKVTLFTTDKSAVYDNEAVSNVSLSNLNFHYPSANKVQENIDIEFLTAYKDKYGKEPNSYAIRGYDLAYDVLLRLSASYQLGDLNNPNVITEYIENKFQYQKSPKGGISNMASYIVKYSEGLLFEVVE